MKKQLVCVGTVLLALLSLLALLIVYHFPGSDAPQRPQSVPLIASNGPGPGIPLQLPRYLRSGQWRADLRSLDALVHYLSEPNLIMETNQIPRLRTVPMMWEPA
jgi:hypothetical protein